MTKVDLNIRLIRTALIQAPGISSKELAGQLNVSQASISRLLSKLKSEIITFGSGKNTKYALKKKISGVEQEVPVYKVDETGNVVLLGRLSPCESNGYLLVGAKNSKQFYYEYLPYWLQDCRPAGFLGRLISKKIPETFPDDIRLWSDADCFRYWTNFAWDLIGNLVVGSKALELYHDNIHRQDSANLKKNKLATKKLIELYENEAENVFNFGSAGSSAQGEQPKFLSLNGENCTIVKFSPKGVGDLQKRRTDLLFCEHICLETLAEYGESVAKSRILEGVSRKFLELHRFDRIYPTGRKGLITLQTLANEFVGVEGTWRELAIKLKERNVIDQKTLNEILWRYYFGSLIANNDMHSGNLSFYCDWDKISGLAPIYDMLPMQLSPQYENVLHQEYQLPLLYPEDEKIWRSALKVALYYWKKIANYGELDKSVRDFANQASKFLIKL